jgi:rod shape-determining protein MreD
MRLDLPVLLALTVVAATVQTLLPSASWMATKPPLLTAVAAYYALSRELPLALTAALWLGALTDVCSGLPFPVTTVWLLILCGVIRSVRRYVSENAFWRGMAILVVAAPGQAIWYAVFVGGIGWEDCLRGLIAAAGIGAGMGWAVFYVCQWLDSLAGNVKGAEPGDGVPWHNSNV